ncbi:hypothetical protein [Nocardia flavorosea]|uniref:Uncharacterized protein n=1 Tax=Nocardia flavorosea TaxID=53429 RepID=A0A846YNB4_9NOCA|nr:hypothetical protein [Nocardia flavorosea]NKY59090.1 hypothetical protein [Nocardia flavorosea]
MTPSASTLPPPQDHVAQVAGLAHIHGPAHQTLRPRLVVLGTSMDDAVSAAGGRIFDLSMAGWEVTVVAGDLGNPRPARILGAHALDLDSVLTRRHRGPQPHAVAISATLTATEHRLRRRVQAYLDHGSIEVSIWGRPYAGGRTESTTHRLSHAARAFKRQALRVVRGEDEVVAATEDFHTGIATRRTPHSRDLSRTGWPAG